MKEQHGRTSEPQADTAIFVEFTNTLAFHDGAADDRIPDGATLTTWLAAHGLLRSRPSSAHAERALPQFRELRDLTRTIATRVATGDTPTRSQVRSLNRHLKDGLHYHQLSAGDDRPRFTVGQVGDQLDQARASIAGSLAHYIAEHGGDRLRVCADDRCRWLFVDRSPAGRRRWCNMRTCGNRAKVAAHRARARQTP